MKSVFFFFLGFLLVGCHATTSSSLSQDSGLALPGGSLIASSPSGGNGEPYTGGDGLADLMLLSGSTFYEPEQEEGALCPSGQPRPSGQLAARVFSKYPPSMVPAPYLAFDECDSNAARVLSTGETEAVVFYPAISDDLDSYQISAYHGMLLLSLGDAAATPPTTAPARLPEAWCSDADHSPSRAEIYVRGPGAGSPFEVRTKVFLDPYVAPTPEVPGSPASYAGPVALARSLTSSSVTYTAPGFVLEIQNPTTSNDGLTVNGSWRASFGSSQLQTSLRCRVQLVN